MNRANRRYARSEKAKAKKRKYDETRIRVRAGGLQFQYRVRPENKPALVARLAAKRAELHKEASGGRIDKTVP